jgi:glycerol-3-phosphate acyltransferase PlsY
MYILYIILILVLSYLLGSLPTGVILVKLINGKDVRLVESGRTGGTNVMRAAGFWAGLGTAVFDMLKSAGAVWLAESFFPGQYWLYIAAPLLAVLGHNYSVFLVERSGQGRWRLRGGAGGAPTIGGAFGLWPISIFIIVPLGAVLLYFLGYASVATLSIALIATLIFAYRAWVGASPWIFLLYGTLAEVILIWALRPNIKRLFEGTERIVGYRARNKK